MNLDFLVPLSWIDDDSDIMRYLNQQKKENVK